MHFEELKNVMEKYDLIDKPHLIFNIDEKGITINHSPPRVVTGSEIHPQAVTSGKSSTITILACGNAIGNSIPPYFVFPGARMRDDLLQGGSPGTEGDRKYRKESNEKPHIEIGLKMKIQNFGRRSPLVP